MARTDSLSTDDGMAGETTETTVPAGMPEESDGAADSPSLSVVPDAEEPPDMGGAANGESGEDPAPGGPQAALESLPVRIDFHAGQVTLPLGSLGNLAPGYTIGSLDEGGFPLVRAVSGGRTFAEGELVDIDGVIGFRILRLVG